MLQNTFLHFRGISFKTESELWRSGVHCWEDWETLRDRLQPRLFEECADRPPGNGLALFHRALVESNADFFAERLPRSEYYRIALTFPKRTLFLDIETTGLSIYYDSITVVGWSYGNEYDFIVQGDDEGKLRDVLADARAIVTFNGSLFDIPFLLKAFPGIPIPRCHVDLRFFAKRVGLSGGQKAIEKHLNIMTRPKGVADLKGENAPLLWSRYCWGDVSALDTLIAYNRADVEGMKVIFDRVVEKVLVVRNVPVAFRNIHRFANGKRNFFVGRRIEADALSVVRTGVLRPNVSIESLSVIDKEPHIRMVGIDLSGSEERASGWCLLEGNFATTTRLNTDAEIIHATINSKPTLISIDSPLSMPLGRTSVRDDDPERAHGIMRHCERVLKKRGVNVYPCLIPSMQRLTERGIRLADKFRKMGIPVIESYPGAAQDIMGIPRKRASLELLAKGLENFGIMGEFVRTQISHDELDAITSAIVGLYFWSGRFEAMGNEDEEFLIIPDLKSDPEGWKSRQVIGLSGRIGSGKTTVGKILEKRGFSYGRYSQILKAKLSGEGRKAGRPELQRLGDRINRKKGQRWLGRRLLTLLPKDSPLVIDGLRFPEDHAFLKETFGPGFFHVHINVGEAERLKRYVRNGGTKKEFLEAEAHKVERKVEKLSELADITVGNEGSLRSLKRQIDLKVLAFLKDGERCS